MMKSAFTSLFVIILTGYSQCDSSNDQKVTDVANCFTLKMYKQLAKDNENLVCSPFSLDVLLSMLLTGAGGQTAKELSTSLGYDGISVKNMENSFHTKLRQLTSSKDNTLEIANSVWFQKGLHIKQSFKDVVENKFLSEEKEVNFKTDSSGATQSINSWGNEKTHGLIPKLLDDNVSPDTIMFLVNAIYFKKQWESTFDKARTQKGPFKNGDSSDSPSTVDLMNQRSLFQYNVDTTLDAEVLEMNYKGGDMSMVLILPRKGSNIDSLENALNCQTFKNGIDSSFINLVDVTMPKYDITSSFDLIKPLMDIGIKNIFEPTANFSGIASNIIVSQAIQKAVIKVFEEGSEAADVTGGGAGFFRLSRVVYFRADHPFLYLIRDKPTGLILFMGRVKSLPNSS